MKWKEKTIGEFVEANMADIQTGPFGTQLKASDYVQDGTPVINVRNIGYGDLRADKLEYVPEHTAERLSAHILQDGDIVFGRKGAVDRHLFVTQTDKLDARFRLHTAQIHDRHCLFSICFLCISTRRASAMDAYSLWQQGHDGVA